MCHAPQCNDWHPKIGCQMAIGRVHRNHDVKICNQIELIHKRHLQSVRNHMGIGLGPNMDLGSFLGTVTKQKDRVLLLKITHYLLHQVEGIYFARVCSKGRNPNPFSVGWKVNLQARFWKAWFDWKFVLIEIECKAQTGKHFHISVELWSEGFHRFFGRVGQSLALGIAFVNHFHPCERQSKKQPEDTSAQVMMDIGNAIRFDLFELFVQAVKSFKPFVFSDKVWRNDL